MPTASDTFFSTYDRGLEKSVFRLINIRLDLFPVRMLST